jgi:hypothetical protein
VDEPLKGPENYNDWCNGIKWLFIIHQVERYVDGSIPRPDPEHDPIRAANWAQNDAFACLIITSNIHTTQMKHTNPCGTSYEMWKALRAVHEPRRYQTLINNIRILFRCSAEEGADIPRHLDLIKDTWECINALGSGRFQISDLFFKTIIASSLPPSWGETDFVNIDPMKKMSSQELIGAIVSEWARRESRMGDASKGKPSNAAYNPTRRPNTKGKVPLIGRISQRPSASNGKEDQRVFCRLCKKNTHETDDCSRWEDLRCNYCHKPGHPEDICWNKHKDKKPGYMGRPTKRSRREEAHGGEAGGGSEEITFYAEAGNDSLRAGYTADSSANATLEKDAILVDATDTLGSTTPVDTTEGKAVFYDEEADSPGEDQDADYNNHGANDMVAHNNGNEDRLLYDWICGCAATFHICNKRDAFTEYAPVHGDVPISGVGNLRARAEGRGTVIVEAVHDGKTSDAQRRPVCAKQSL